jgi:hypothetical protein
MTVPTVVTPEGPAANRPPEGNRRAILGYLVMGLIVISGAVWSFGALVEIGNIATTQANLTTLPAPIAGWLFAGSVDLFIFFGYLKCYGPAWQIVLSVVHILLGLATSVWLQYQHSMGRVDPVLVSVIPPLAVAVSLDTWVVSQLIDWRRAFRPDWPIPTPKVPDPEVPTPVEPKGPERPRPRVAQDAVRRRGPATRVGPSLPKADQVALDRAAKNGPEAVEAAVARRGLERSLVAARPERWPLPSRNGDGS